MLDAALRHGAVPRTVFAVPDPPEQLDGLLARLPAQTERVTASADALAVAGIARQRLARDRGVGAAGHRVGTGSAGARTGSLPPRRRRSRERRDRAAVGARVRSRLRRAEPAHGRPVRPQGGARRHGRRVRAADVAAPTSSRHEADRRAIALVPGAGRPLRDVALDGDVLFALGAERAGLPEAVVAACEEIAHVPVDHGGADSLNVAMAATLCLYEYRATHA